MAIDFSQVKTITIPEGSVKQITDSQGNILWKQAAQWHTLWTGSKTITATGTSISGSSTSFCQTAASTGKSPKIRITFTTLSGQAVAPGVVKYFNNSTSNTPNTTTKPTSPVTITLNSAATVYALGIYSQTNYAGSNSVFLVKTNGASSCYLSLYGDYTGNPSNTNISKMVITKIEQYY